MINRTKAKFEPIGQDKKSGERGYFCVSCGATASQTTLFRIEGAIIVERYCDYCAKKVN